MYSKSTVYKFDFFGASTAFHFSQLHRAVQLTFDFMGEPVTCRLATAEDTVLAKLDLYAKGGRASERQLRDVASVLAIAGDRLDYSYLGPSSRELAPSDLWAQVSGDPEG